MEEFPENYLMVLATDHTDRKVSERVLQCEYEGQRADHLSLWLRDEKYNHFSMITLDLADTARLSRFLLQVLDFAEKRNKHEHDA